MGWPETCYATTSMITLRRVAAAGRAARWRRTECSARITAHWQDAVICAAILDSGQHLVQEVAWRRQVWLHVVQGDVSLGDVILGARDGIGVETAPAVGWTAREDRKLLRLDRGAVRSPGTPGGGSS